MNLMRRWHNNFITTMIYRLAEHNSLQMTNLTVCLDGFEPGLIYIGPVQVSPEKIYLAVYIELFRSEQMTHNIQRTRYKLLERTYFNTCMTCISRILNQSMSRENAQFFDYLSCAF